MPATNYIFKKYPNNLFIETGSQSGHGIIQALLAGFKTVYSIESEATCVTYCRDLFQDDDRVHIFHGDSRIVLRTLLFDVIVPVTFWLDGHNEDDYPIMEELEAIAAHHIKTHTILIDDLRMFDIKKHGFDLNMIKKRILEINSKYSFNFENGHTKNDILVAVIK